MKVYSLLLTGAAVLFLSSCMQNFKNSEFTVVNSSDSRITLHFNGERIVLSTNESKTMTDNLNNSGDFRPDKYQYSTIYTLPDTLSDDFTIEEGENLSGEVDFTSGGTKISLEYISTEKLGETEYDTIWTNVEKTEYSGIKATTKKTYKISAIKSEGWTKSE